MRREHTMGIRSKTTDAFSLFRRAFGEEKKKIIALVIMSCVSSVFGGVGIGAIIPLFSFIQGGGAQTSTDQVSVYISHFFAWIGISYSLYSLIFFIFALFLFKAFFLVAINYLAANTVVSFENRMRLSLFAKTFGADWCYLTKHKLGHLDQLITNYVARASAPLNYFGGSIVVSANLLVYIMLALHVSFVVTLLALCMGGVGFLFFKPFFRKNVAASSELSLLSKDFGHFVNQSVLGMKSVKSMSVEKPLLARAALFFDRIRRINLEIAVVRSISNVLIEPFSVAFVLGILVYFLSVEQGLNFGSFAVMVYSINKIFSQTQFLQSDLHSVISSLPFLREVLKYREEAGIHKETDSGLLPFSFTNALQLQNIQFSYTSREPVLTGVTVTLKRGTFLGLIGPSGAGKTTLVDLILRLYRPESGTLLLDGLNSELIRMEDWRRNVGYVSQDIFLLNDTIENNIRFYNPLLTEKEIREAARMANILTFIEKLPRAFKTVVGERGVLLSAGQRQRIVLARVLAQKPSLLILDEATSALDNESETLVHDALIRLKGKITVLAIAHRLSTVKAADILIVLDGGKIVEEGHPEVLLKDKDSYFFKMYHLRT